MSGMSPKGAMTHSPPTMAHEVVLSGEWRRRSVAPKAT